MMENYQASNVRNVCLIGHGRTGKTTLCEAMLYKSSTIDACGNVENGNTTTDYDPEEIKRKFSIKTALAPLVWKDIKINVIDTPGYFDFEGGVYEGVRAADAAIITVSGKSGVVVGTELAYQKAKERGIPCLFFVNKLDSEKADYYKVLEQLKATFGKQVAPFLVPVKEGDHFEGFINVLEKKMCTFEGQNSVDSPMPESMKDEVEPIVDMIKEAAAETSDELMEKYFAGEEFTKEEMHIALKAGIKDGSVLPVFCGSSSLKIGVLSLLDAIVEYFPSPDEVDDEIAILKKEDGSEEEVELSKNESEPVALVFKTVSDPYVGKLSFFRVYAGTVLADSMVYNINRNCSEKIGKLYMMRGKKQIEVKSISRGDIGATTKLLKTMSGDTLCSPKKHVMLSGVSYPIPNLNLALYAVKKGDEEKISAGLFKIHEEDPTFVIHNNTETHEQIISGIGEQQLDVVLSKLKLRYGVEAVLKEPIVPYRETIRKKVRAEGKHKKQSGGHGQYGHVFIEFEPGDNETLTFEEKIVGGVVPKNYFPAVEKGILESCEHGVLAGYPVVYLKASLVDGSYHPVDSSEMAFKVAASLAYKDGLSKATPVLLEPIGALVVRVPESMMGDVIGDINKRRGRIIGMNPMEDGKEEVSAEVPMSEMVKYATNLRSMTQGRGRFDLNFARYEAVADNVATEIIEEAKKRHEAER